MTTRADVRLELDEMAKVGMKVPAKAYEALESMDDDELDHMTSTEASDLCVDIGGLD